MASGTAEPIAVAILAKAPVAGTVKTRLIPALGAEGAAKLHERMIERTVETAHAAAIGPVTLWVTPDEPHPYFIAAAERHRIALAHQPNGDLGARMLAAMAPGGHTIVVGTDCPVLMPAQLRLAAEVLREVEVVVFPAEPVTPISVFPHRRRTAAAKVCSATKVSATGIRRRESGNLLD